MTTKWLLAVSLGMAVSASSAFAQDSAPPACSGNYEIIRTDTIKPGKLDEFLKAVHDHQAWYTAHGFKDRVLVGRIWSPDHGADGFSGATAMTIHTDMTSTQMPRDRDAGWDAYVAEYRDSSDVAATAIVCVAPAPGPGGAAAH
jgi:hypothetical protein